MVGCPWQLSYIHLDTLSLPPLNTTVEGEHKKKNLLGWVKNREITYHLSSGAEQTWGKLI